MSATLELLREAQKGNRDACEQVVLENNGLIWSVGGGTMDEVWSRMTSISWDVWDF